jgi:predicted MPP superfamily phosphohydrolase
MHRLLTGPLSIERVQVQIADLPNSLKGLTLVQLSDLHFDGLRLSNTLLHQAIAASNAAEPDLVLLTGDLVTSDPDWIYRLVPWLKRLSSRYGVYVALGNHDNCYRRSRPEITRALTDAGIRVLWNQIAYPVGKELPLVGLADYWSSDFSPASVMGQLDPGIPRIVLSHNPDSAEYLQDWRVDLQLSGHTHGGQVIIPGIGNLSHHIASLYGTMPKRLKRYFPWMKECYRVAQHWEWAQGLHHVGNNLLYVNRGLGTYLPGRLFCPPEVTILTLIS